ncbi:Phthiotriol/phenolphthiotriol dimycocerosates methyltransferase [Kingella potus]|uniref:Phthiotriol/phenolphthiotriol dimycocerosates methyltransferase n=1 Tax=Kingella potus TaxID=265175 RepID=A0A377R1X9_9NEIS|nr:methyltransferase domain-containing protein [Kingella potus]UOP00664.1 methyltransferase domain-containing protein [Kingella potus]STR02938.1 Phthiotriol/phenolphthiotriol dimycocerosates methyltransferase [Kingella potus]
MNPNLAPLLRQDLNPAYLAEEHGILRYLNPADLAGDNGKYQKLYDRLAPLYDIGENWLARLKYGNGIAKMRREMMRLIDWQNGANVLYVSVGTGNDFRYFPDTVNAGSLNIVGADLSLGMLRRAQKTWQRRLNLSLVHCAAEDLPFADNRFDIVFHVGGINFFSDQRRALAEMLRVAKPDTRLMVADETQDLVEQQYQKSVFTQAAYQNAQVDVSAITNALPDNAVERQTHILWSGRFYALTFRKAA